MEPKLKPRLNKSLDLITNRLTTKFKPAKVLMLVVEKDYYHTTKRLIQQLLILLILTRLRNIKILKLEIAILTESDVSIPR
jgi:hypothetical protein